MKKENILAAPKVEKVVISMKLGEDRHDKVLLAALISDLAAISGQQPKICRAKKAIASFKIQAGEQIGLMVTLRGQRMVAFLKKLFKIVLPRVRDFQGVKLAGFDGRGNYSLGINEYAVFSEINSEKIKKVHGLEVTLVTTAGDDKKGQKLLAGLGMPFAHAQGEPKKG